MARHHFTKKGVYFLWLKTVLKLVCGKGGVRNGLRDYSDSDYSDSEDFEAYDSSAGYLTVINVEQTAVV